MNDQGEAIELGQRLTKEGYMVHVLRDHQFKNEHLFFRFMEHEKNRGHAADVSFPNFRKTKPGTPFSLNTKTRNTRVST